MEAGTDEKHTQDGEGKMSDNVGGIKTCERCTVNMDFRPGMEPLPIRCPLCFGRLTLFMALLRTPRKAKVGKESWVKGGLKCEDCLMLWDMDGFQASLLDDEGYVIESEMSSGMSGG